MTARLGQDALAGIHHHDGNIGRRGAGGHVARILFMAGRVGDDELALVGSKETIGDIDRDALLALGGQAIDQKGEVDVLALCADFPGIILQRGQLVLEDHLGIIQKAADQRRLAIIHRTTGDEAEQGFVLMLLEIGGDIRFNQFIIEAHQK